MLVYKNLYREVGNLFYAIAAIDRKISKNEKKMITSLVNYNWKPLENSTDTFGSDAANIILFQLDVNEGMDAAAEEKFESFVYFFEENYPEIAPVLREKILSSARNIAETTRKINNAEFKILMKLRYLVVNGHLKGIAE